MLHAIMSNPNVQTEIQKLLSDLAMIIGSILGIALVQVAAAIKNSHLNMVQKMIAERLVGYAEQTITSSSADKAAYVTQKLREKFPGLKDEDVAHLLEAAVSEVKAQLNPTTTTVIVPPPASAEVQVTTSQEKPS